MTCIRRFRDDHSDFVYELTQICSAFNENAELGAAGVEPGAGGFGFYLPALKIADPSRLGQDFLLYRNEKNQRAVGKEIQARASEIGFGLHVELGFSLFGGRQC